MIDLVDFNGYAGGAALYGGNAGRKIGIVYDGGICMVKYPELTREMKGKLASYTTSPLSEYLGSHIYGLLGIPVHETVLGHREGKALPLGAHGAGVLSCCRESREVGSAFDVSDLVFMRSASL